MAASRRVMGADGKIRVRWSACKDPELRAAPEGYFDPLPKTVTFSQGDRPLVRLHYDATHPQTGYSDGGTGYLCTKESYGQGGYEPSSTSIAPEGEAVLKAAIRQALDAAWPGR